jgi:catechol 2,3-dioxygenase-like lactoylglutathione lyase family enzyme
VDTADHARMIVMLPCPDIEEMAEFWTALGLSVTYRQLRPNPYVALRRGGIDLHYFGMPGVAPEDSYSTCMILVPETAELYDLFTAGLRARSGKVPLTGVPRITRPRKRANNAGLSGFSVIDPAGNWVRVSRLPDAEHQPRTVDERVEWVSEGGGRLAAALENAVVMADSHGDVPQALRILGGAVGKHNGPPSELARALAFLAELQVRTGQPDQAQQTLERLTALAADDTLGPDDLATVREAVAEAEEAVGDAPPPDGGGQQGGTAPIGDICCSRWRSAPKNGPAP